MFWVARAKIGSRHAIALVSLPRGCQRFRRGRMTPEVRLEKSLVEMDRGIAPTTLGWADDSALFVQGREGTVEPLKLR
jgi:hypothetical protein